MRELTPFSGMRTRVPTNDLPIEFVIAVMEVEAWFLQEWNHYEQIDQDLTIQSITDGAGFNPESDNAADILLPADTLNQIYQLVGKSYNKKKVKVKRTVEALDYENLYENVCVMLPQLNQFIGLIDNFV